MNIKNTFIQNLNKSLNSNNLEKLKEYLSHYPYYQLTDNEYFIVCLSFHKINDYLSSNKLIYEKFQNIKDFKLKRKILRLEIFNLFFLRQLKEIQSKISIALDFSFDQEIIKIYYLTCRNIEDYRNFFINIKKNILKNKPSIQDSLNLINFLNENQEYELLSILLFRIYKFDKKNKIILDKIANNYFFQKKYSLAKKYFKKLLLIENNSNYLINLAIVSNYLRHENDFQYYVTECIKIDPNNFQAADFYISRLSNKNTEQLIFDLKKKEQDSINSSKFDLLFYTLSRLYEKNKDYKNAYYYFTRANQIKDNESKFDLNKIVQESNFFLNHFKKKQVYTSNDLQEFKKNPIFIVGLPRSGTTLIEHILGSHNKVQHFGETNYFYRNFKFLFDIYHLDKNFDIFKKYKAIDYFNYGKLYLNYFHITKDKTHFTDKMPYNFYYLGLIRYTLPNSKIILCKRDYKDTGLSILKNNFAQETDFAYNEKKIIDFIKNFHRVTNEWKNILNDEIFEIEYENLIQNPKKNVSSLLEFCDLPFDSSCLEFYKKKLSADTLSVNQVTQNFYDSSVGGWKKYYNYSPSFFDSLAEIK